MPLNPNIIMGGNALNFQPSVNKSNAIANQNAFVDTQSKRQGMDRVAGEMRQAEADNFVGNLKKAAGILSSSRNPEEYQALLTEGVRLGMVNNEQAASWGQVEWSPENMADIANQGRNLEDIMSERAATETARVKTDVDINTATALSDRAVTADTVASDRAVTAKTEEDRRRVTAAGVEADRADQRSMDTYNRDSVTRARATTEFDQGQDDRTLAKKKAKRAFAKGQSMVGDVRDLATDLLAPENRDALLAVTGAVSSRTPTFTASSIEAENNLERLTVLLTVGNLDLMTGILTDNDIKFLAKIGAGGIDKRLGKSAIIKGLKEIVETSTRSLDAGGWEDMNDRPKAGEMTNRPTDPRAAKLAEMQAQYSPDDSSDIRVVSDADLDAIIASGQQ